MRDTLLAFTIALLCSAPAAGDGSVDWRDVEPLLESQPSVRAVVLDTFEVGATGMATRVGSHQPHLGGARLGPYRFAAVRKSDRIRLLLTICTWPTFFDASGNPAAFEDAASFKERLVFVALSEESQPGPACNDWGDFE